jgi:hypothetical protein
VALRSPSPAAKGRDFPARWLCFGNREIGAAVVMHDAAMGADLVA